MTYADTRAELMNKRASMEALRQEMRALQANIEPQPVKDYELQGWAGPWKLSQMFGGKSDLIVIHNMGKACSSCTMWADGFNGVYQHLASRAAFVLTSPDPVDVQKAWAGDRGWRFPMASHVGTTFAADMGYCRPGEGSPEHGGWEPGISVFQTRGDRLVRVSDAELGPFDGFCVVYSLFDLIPEGAEVWNGPKYTYA